MTAGAFYLFRTPDAVDQLGPGMLAFLRRTVAERGPQFVKHGDYRDGRSLPQNDMFRGLCRDIAEAWNSDHDDKTSADAIARDLKVTYGVILTEWALYAAAGACEGSVHRYPSNSMRPVSP